MLQGIDFECSRCCETSGNQYNFRLLPFKAIDECKTDVSKKGRVIPSVADYRELRASAQSLAVVPAELDLAEWGIQRVNEWLQDLLVRQCLKTVLCVHLKAVTLVVGAE